MSADACIAYFGLRFEVRPDEIEAFELDRDQRLMVAKKAGLSTYWGNFGGQAERYILLVGTKIAILGPENVLSVSSPAEGLAAIIAATTSRLKEAGLEGEPRLHLEWQEDV